MTPSIPRELLFCVFPVYIAHFIRELKGDKEEPVCVCFHVNVRVQQGGTQGKHK